MRPLDEILQERHDDPNDPFTFHEGAKYGKSVTCPRCAGIGSVTPESLSILEERIKRRGPVHRKGLGR